MPQTKTNSDTTCINHKLMRHAIKLAKEIAGQTAPNPNVGCVIVDSYNRIIAEGQTEPKQGKHAEIVALEKLQPKTTIKPHTMYVTLEPCCHHGQNPPCTTSIISAGIKKIVIGMQDHFHKVNGKGIETLRTAGIEVICGICEAEIREILRGFISRITHKRPYITLKLATSADGKIALKDGKSKWITSKEQRLKSHELRIQNDAIMVGIGTVLCDNPLLTRRHPRYKQRNKFQPTRIILDSNLRIPINSKICNSTYKQKIRTIIFTSETHNPQKAQKLKELGIEIYIMHKKPLELKKIMQKLAELGINDLLVEGGQKLATELLKSHLINQTILFIAPFLIGNDGIACIEALKLESLQKAKKQFPVEIVL